MELFGQQFPAKVMEGEVVIDKAIKPGIFYGRARRVAASTITHASVDWIWGLWF
jgi:hypothetical protein